MSFAALIDRFAAAAQSGNGDALADLFTVDGVYDDYFFGPCQGRAAIKRMLVHFSEGGSDFRWDFHSAIGDATLGYASYRFSYASTAPGADGGRVCFEGIGRFDLEAGKIERYSEVFDRGMALAQQNFAPERIARIARRYACALKARAEWAAHVKA